MSPVAWCLDDLWTKVEPGPVDFAAANIVISKNVDKKGEVTKYSRRTTARMIVVQPRSTFIDDANVAAPTGSVVLSSFSVKRGGP